MAGSRILEGYRPPYTATERRATSRTPARRCSARRTRTSSRWAPPTRTPATARSRTRGTARACRAAPRAAAPPRSRPAPRRGRSARTPAARSASRPRSAGSSGMKPTYGAVSRYGMIAFASSLDQCGPLTRDVTDAALLLRPLAGPRPVRLHLARHRRRGRRCPAPSASTACASAIWGLDEEGLEPGVAEQVRGDARRGSRSSAAASSEVELPHARATASPPTT